MLDSNFVVIVKTSEISEGLNEALGMSGGRDGCGLVDEGSIEARGKSGGSDGCSLVDKGSGCLEGC